ncbi:rhomboid family intramembrane serine protease [Halopseudomonas bauzanensis]|uniref:Rhomboid family intramembrane serine protease n=1 Tax=Halopseudomonas bauzanensis TaxID=653930 RepID=A0A4U0YJE7_9GAMM|nr:rhomboid family intramembrane serine protease [Halopseudomonas bauzanensis]EZQ17186.1 peptidase S54 [Halopseudomonas bauzanensis]TKA90236.1 rhomboid family intramembrane serine protease [Halopseudomonas bauzanensis]
MSMYRALQCRLDEDLSSLTHFLRARGVAHRITEERGRQVIWTRNEADAAIVRGLYTQGVPEPVADSTTAAPRRPPRLAWQRMARLIPVTLLVLLVTAVVALITGLGSNIQTVVLFTFTPVTPAGYIAAAPDMDQWWRLVAPMFLHFGWLHLAFNALWYWELGRRIELRSGGWWLLGLTLLFAVISNTAQWLFGGPALFGGLSGVLYGLLGYCWLYQTLAPNVHFDLPRGVVVMMLGWLVLCLSGVVTMLGFGAIANAAHVGGLVIGSLCGAIAGGLQRMR